MDDPANADLLVQSAIGDFECALAQYVVATGLVSDELIDAQFAAVGWDYDRRTITATGGPYATATCGSIQVPGLYAPLSIARFQADDALRRLEAWTDEQVPNRTDLIATAAAYAGYSLVLLGESMCSAALDVGPELTPAELLSEAETRFTRAIETATVSGNTAILNMALAGRARARRGLGNLTGARTDAMQIPEGFVHDATYSEITFRRENLVNTQMYRGNFSSVGPAFRDLTFSGVPDPRVVVVATDLVGQDGATPIWQPAKYPTSSTPIPIASWDEAQLIIAEAELEAGNVQDAVDIINVLHDRAGLPSFNSSDAQQVRSQIIEERSRELFLEGHRLSDIIRYELPLVPPPGAPFPIKGGTYGDQLCFPLPDVERNNNPNI
ncbi:MAG: RagB/SusD family nutrient uptake outer membrane protein [Longimicrobiales bacterium]